jgi:phenylacetate-CoA ligase
LSLLISIYNRSPLWIQIVGINTYGWYWKRLRRGKVFARSVPRWIERETWKEDRFRDYLDRKLADTLKIAYEWTEFYPEKWSAHGLSCERINNIKVDDLRLLPVTRKDEFRKIPGSVWRNGPKGHDIAFVRRTSGSTGSPLPVAFSKEDFQYIYAAAEARSFRWAGISIEDPRSMIGARPIIPPAQKKPPFWRYNLFERQVYLSAFHIAPANVEDYCYALNRFKPVFMTGFPSANFFLARMIDEAGLEVHSPRAVVTCSEKLVDEMKETMERVYSARVYESYGLVEHCALATTCEYGSLHVSPDFGIVEILRDDGSPAAPGETGHLVATGLANNTSLFVRYDTGDLAAWSDEPCPCGRTNLPRLRNIEGRVEDVVIGPDGRETVRFDRIFFNYPGIEKGQVIQESPNHIRLKIVTSAGYSKEAEREIQNRVRAILGEVKVSVEHVNSIPLDKNGKFRAVISKVKRAE